ncbi:MAG: hypothetical protein IPO92_16055 [Saprospiraceae bacterium]|nr:hypothetical protein [Saprospiraceae bacterium]
MIKRTKDYLIMKCHNQKNQGNPSIRIIKVQTMWQLFGGKTEKIINELNEALAA